MDELPILDRDRLERITRGNSALAAEFLDGLFEESVELIARLRELLGGSDQPAVSGVAHTLKGMATELGAMRLRAAAAALENETRSETWTACTDRICAAIDELHAHRGQPENP